MYALNCKSGRGLHKEQCGERILTFGGTSEAESDAFEDDGDALAYADAHGAEGVFPAGAQELVRGGSDEARSAGAERMAECDCATVGINVRRVVGDAEFAENG